MKKKLNVFKSLFADKSKRTRVLFSVVVLVLLSVVLVSTVSAWVETISTVIIKGEGVIDKPIYTHAEVAKSSTNPIDLNSYFRKAGNMHFSEASSADGVNFFFPVADSTGSTNYRKNNINDVGVNYLNFTLKVKSAEAASFVFNDEPEITVGGNKISNSAVRMAVTFGGSTSIYSLEESTASVVSSVTGAKTSTNVQSFADYSYGNSGNKNVFSLAAGEEKELTISLWLQEGIATGLSGKEIVISHLSLIPSSPRFKVEATAVTDDNSKDAKGGTVKVGSAAAGAYSFENVEEGKTVSLVATPKEGHRFLGWYDAATGGTLKSSSTTYSLSNVAKAHHYYARFATEYNVYTYVVYNGAVYNSTALGTVKAGSTAAGATSQYTALVGEDVIVTATDKTTSKFTGWYDAITGGTCKTTSKSYTISDISAETKLYARYVDAYTYTAHAVSDGTNNSSSGGTVKLNTNSASTNSGVKMLKDETVTAVAAVKSGYTFEGWYSGTTTSSTKLSSSATITFAAGGKIGTTTVPSNIYAIFTPTYSVTAHAVYNSSSNDDSTGGTVKVSSGTAGATSTAESVKKGSSITVTAAVSDTSKYKFVGWYDSRTGGTQLADANSLSYTFNVTQNTDVFARFEPTGKTLYFVPSSDWNTDTPRYAAYVWGDNISAKWYSMSDGNGDGVYSVTVDAKYTKVIFCRMNPANTSNNWDNRWNQTEDQTIPTNGNNKFTITTSYNGNNKGEGTWSKQ